MRNGIYQLTRHIFFNLVEKGSKILIEEFPGQDDIENTKETIEKI